MNDRAAWLEERRGGLGGTDAAAALAISKWKSPLDVYLSKRGELPEIDDNPAMYWGRTLEPIVRDEYAKQTGVGVVFGQPMARSTRYPWMIGNFDGRRQDDGRIVEIKTARSPEEWGEPGSADVPTDYVLQVTHYMVIAEVAVADIAVLIGGSDYRQYTVPLDAELAEMMIEAERELWDRIVRGDPPAPRTAADVANLYRIAKAQPIEATAAIHAAWQALRELRESAKANEAAAIALETEIKAHLGACDTLTYQGQTLATWKQRKATERLDGKRLKAEAPDIWTRFAVAGEPTRTFILKEVKQ